MQVRIRQRHSLVMQMSNFDNLRLTLASFKRIRMLGNKIVLMNDVVIRKESIVRSENYFTYVIIYGKNYVLKLWKSGKFELERIK